MEIRMAYPEDFNLIYPLLDRHDHRIPREIWQNLFKRPWQAALDHYGYMLLDNSKCVGFIGTIFSQRRLGGMEYNCCNISSWVVREDCRRRSLSLLFPILKLKDWLITNLTPNWTVYKILRKMGFQDLDTGFKIFLPFVQKRSRNCRILTHKTEIFPHLSPSEAQILNDHLYFNCLSLLLLVPDGSCFLLATRLDKKKVPLARLDYIGNAKILQENLGNVVDLIAYRWRVVAVISDERFLTPNASRWLLSYRLKQPRLYRGLRHDRQLLDNLYSELVMLGI
jgi:hypothetical protein